MLHTKKIILIAGVKFALNLVNTRAMKKFGARLYGAVIPGCEGFELHSDDYWACLCRHQTMTVYHYSGTAKMGPSEKSGEYMLTRASHIFGDFPATFFG